MADDPKLLSPDEYALLITKSSQYPQTCRTYATLAVAAALRELGKALTSISLVQQSRDELKMKEKPMAEKIMLPLDPEEAEDLLILLQTHEEFPNGEKAMTGPGALLLRLKDRLEEATYLQHLGLTEWPF